MPKKTDAVDDGGVFAGSSGEMEAQLSVGVFGAPHDHVEKGVLYLVSRHPLSSVDGPLKALGSC